MKQEKSYISPEKVLEALALCPNTAYKIAKDTGLTITTIANYKKGKSKPAKMAIDVLVKYLRLDDYYASARTETYQDYIKKEGYKILVLDGESFYDFAQETLDGGSRLFDSAAEAPENQRDMYLQLFISLKNELAAAHAMIMAMRETNEFLENEVIRLRQRKL